MNENYAHMGWEELNIFLPFHGKECGRMLYVCVPPSIPPHGLTRASTCPPFTCRLSSALHSYNVGRGYWVWGGVFLMCYALNRKWSLISQCWDGLLPLLSLEEKLLESVSLTISIQFIFQEKEAKHIFLSKKSWKAEALSY